MATCVFLANYWAADYKILLFREIHRLVPDMHVLYLGDTENMREWRISRSEVNYPHSVLFTGSIDRISPVNILRSTWKSLNLHQPDVVILGGYHQLFHWAGFLWAKLNGKKTVLWSASNQDDRARSALKERVKGCFVRNCDAADVYGTKNRDYLVSLGLPNQRIFLKGNACDNDFYHRSSVELRADKSALCGKAGLPSRNFLYIGRFSPEKNILRLLEAFRALPVETRHSWGLILVGSGPQTGELETYARGHSLQNVFFPGFQQKQDIPRFMAMSDVFVLPSISEPWGLVVNEAMASSLPVLVSRRCGCYPDLLREGGNGFSFDPFDAQSLSALMREFAQGLHDIGRMGALSQEIIARYTPARAAQVVFDTIESVLSTGR